MNSHTQKTTVFFDAVGTLIKPAQSVAQTYSEFALDFDVQLDHKEVARAFTTQFHTMPTLAFDFNSADSLHDQEYAWWQQLVSGILKECGVQITRFDDYFARLYTYYKRGDSWQLYPEVSRVLARLAALDIHMAVVSNFDSRLPTILKELDIYGYFDDVVYSSRVGYAKPHPQIFYRALTSLDAKAERVLHIGDDLLKDFNGAQSAGIDALIVDRRADSKVSNEQTITSLDSLITWLD